MSGDRLATLIQINTDDILGAVGVDKLRWGRPAIRLLCRPATRRFALQVIEYDRQVGCVGLRAAGAQILSTLHNQLTIYHAQRIPSHGPVFFLANHPGLTDTVALFASIPRLDLRILAADRPFLRALPNTSRQLIYLDEERGQNLDAVRQGAAHLRTGGALLTFPAGKIEPDPAVLPGAVASLCDWSASSALFARLVTEMQIVPVLVRGVLNPHTQRSPLRLLRRSQKDREWLAAMLQILVPAYQAVAVSVTFGNPLPACRFGRDRTALMEAVRKEMRRMMVEPCRGTALR